MDCRKVKALHCKSKLVIIVIIMPTIATAIIFVFPSIVLFLHLEAKATNDVLANPIQVQFGICFLMNSFSR